MKYILLTAEAQAAIRAAAKMPFRETGERQPDGIWRVPVDELVFEAIQAKRLEGESDSDVVLRYAARERGLN